MKVCGDPSADATADATHAIELKEKVSRVTGAKMKGWSKLNIDGVRPNLDPSRQKGPTGMKVRD